MKFLVLFLLLFNSTTFAGKLDPEPKRFQEVVIASGRCNGPSQRQDTWKVIRMPDDVPYKFVSVGVDIITRQTDKNGYDQPVWDPTINALTIHAWSDRGDCTDWPIGSTGTDSGIQIRVVLNVLKNECTEISEPPGSTKVNEAIDGYKKAVGSFRCVTSLRKKQHDSLIKDFDAQIKQKIVDKGGYEKAKVIDKESKLKQVKNILADYQGDVQGVSLEYKSLMVEYEQNRKIVQNQRISFLKNAVKRANGLGVAALSELTAEAISFQRNSSAYDSEWIAKIDKLELKMRLIESQMNENLADFGEYLTAEKIEKPNSLAAPRGVLQKIHQSLDKRSTVTLEKALELVQSIQVRQDALLNSIASSEAKKTKVLTEGLNASAQFLAQVNLESKVLPKLGNSSSLYEAWTRANSYLRFEELCSNPKRQSWTQAGCVIAMVDIEKAKVVLNSILPRKIRDRQYSAADQSRKIEIDSALQAGDIKTAARISDQVQGVSQ